MDGTTILLLTWLGIKCDMNSWYFVILILQAVLGLVEIASKLISR